MSTSFDHRSIIHAEEAVKTLHRNIVNPPTTVAAAILPSLMADRLQLACTVFSLESFCRVLKDPSPELALISAALPVSYIKAEIMVNNMFSTRTTQGSLLISESEQRGKLVDAEAGASTLMKLPRSKTDLTLAPAELSSSTTSNIRKCSYNELDIIPSDLVSADGGILRTICGFVRLRVSSFHGLYWGHFELENSLALEQKHMFLKVNKEFFETSGYGSFSRFSHQRSSEFISLFTLLLANRRRLRHKESITHETSVAIEILR